MTGVPSPPQGSDEATRLAALRSLGLLDSEPEQEFDSLVALTARLLDCPVGLLTLIDHDRQWIKACAGIAIVEVPRATAFCDHTIRNGGPLVVGDTRLDARFADHPHVAGPPNVRFYAGMPIHTTDAEGVRHAIGSLCVVDTKPRSLDDAARRSLAHLAALAEALITARAAEQRAVVAARAIEDQSALLKRHARILRQAERMAMMGSWRRSLTDDGVDWSDGVYRIYEVAPGTMLSTQQSLEFYSPQSIVEIRKALDRIVETGETIDLEADFTTALGRPRRVRLRGEIERTDGVATGLIGVIQDVTERHALESTLRRSANTDALTGLSNRAAFDRLLEVAIDTAHRDDSALLLALIDLDGFKTINDTLGHNAGDDVLRAVGRVLGADWLRGCCAARLGGDEFALIIDDADLARDPDRLHGRLQESLRVPVSVDGLAMIAAGTIGMARLESDCRTVRDLVHRADMILYAAKRMRVGTRRHAA